MKRFTPEEDNYIREHYLTETYDQMAINLNRSMGSVAGRLRFLNLVVPEDIKKEQQFKGLQEGWKKNTSTRFKKGHKTWNKGLKGVCTGGKKTQFKKGHIPHNVKYDGATRITADGYIEVRVSLGNWKLKHRLVWEEHNGPIPKGYLIRFRDKNPLNTDISNLYIITRRQNMDSNTIHRYPAELKQAIRGLRKLNKTIKNQKNETN